MKKTISILLLVAFISVMAIGCSSTPTPAPTPPKEEYPIQNINGIIPWGAGGGTDMVSRLVVPAAQEYLGKSIIMVNKTGATGSIGHQYVYDQKADGYTLLFHTGDATLYPILGLSQLTYKEFEPIFLFANVAGVIVVSKDSPYNTLDDLINNAKKSPGKLKMGISGVGGLPYVSSIMLNQIADIKFSPVTYDGDGTLSTALMGNQIDVTVLAAGAAIQYIKSGDFKGLAVVSNKTIDAIPDVPALGILKPEAQNMLKTVGPYFGVFVKKETPEPVIKKLTEAFKKGYEDQKFRDYVKASGFVLLGYTGNEAKEYISKWQSQGAWLLYDAGNAKESPEKFGIPRPAK